MRLKTAISKTGILLTGVISLGAGSFALSATKDRVVPIPRYVDTGCLEKELLAANYKGIGFMTGHEGVSVTLSSKDTRDIQAHVSACMRPQYADLYRLAAKWKAGKITPEEKDQLLQRMIFLQLGIE